jgi:hypothetical protein
MKMTDGEQLVWAAVWARRWQHECDLAMKTGKLVQRDAAVQCALSAANAVDAMRCGSDDPDLDGDAREMLFCMIGASP